MLWYFVHCTALRLELNVELSPFDHLLRAYIPPLRYGIDGSNDRHSLYVDRALLIKIHLVRECAIMHRHKNRKLFNDHDIGESEHFGIDSLYLVEDRAMNLILPHTRFQGKQFILYITPHADDWSSSTQTTLSSIYRMFHGQWTTPTDIFEVFRSLNQLYIEHKLNEKIRTNEQDLRCIQSIHSLYQRNRNKMGGLINELCDGDNPIHDALFLFDEEKNDEIQIRFESPKRILHLTVHYIMVFINKYDDRGRACCELSLLRNEMKSRGLFSEENVAEHFDNLKTLIDERQFQLKRGMITSNLKRNKKRIADHQ